MKLKSIEINNFKAFDHFKIDFTSNKNGAENELELGFVANTKNKNHVLPYLNYIIGRNSIGKTTILDALVFFSKFVTNKQANGLQEKLARRLLNIERLKKENLLWKLKRDELLKKYRNEFAHGKHDQTLLLMEQKIYRDEYYSFARNNKKPIIIKLLFDKEQDFYVELVYPTPKTNEVNNAFYNPNIILKNKTHLSNLLEWARGTFKNCKISNLVTSEHSYHWFNMELDLKNAVMWLINKFQGNKRGLGDLNKLVKLANPLFIEFIAEEGAIRYVEKKATLAQSLNNLSLGTKKFLKFLYLISTFAENKNGVLLIDEIENHLHKELVNVIKIGLMEVAKKYDLQVIITTHNPLMLKNFTTNKQIISLDDEDKQIIAAKVSSKMKPKNSVTKKYENNEIAMFPEPNYAKKISRNIFAKW